MNDLALIPINDMARMADAVVKSGFFGVKTADQALALMLIAQAEGKHPAEAARDYHVIQGRPALKSDAMLARFQAAGGSVKWTEYTDQRVAGIFSHPQGGSVEVDWTIARAKQAGLGGKDNWKNYPRQMLRARVISEGVRTVFPGATSGMYTVEETQDFTPAVAREMGAAEVVTAAPAELLKAATAAAEQGSEAYAAFWKETGKDNRHALKDEHERLKGIANNAVETHDADA